MIMLGHQNAVLRVWGMGLRVSDIRFGVQGVEVSVYAEGFRVWALVNSASLRV